MNDRTFFEGIPHAELPWGERVISAPAFFYDMAAINAYFLAPYAVVRALLPSERLLPLRVLPGRCIVSISAFEYRDCDLGPYNEVAVAIPVTLDRPSPRFTGTLRAAPAEPWAYVRHLPVTTEVARDAGIEFGGYPKSLGDIRFESRDGWIECRLEQDGRHVLTLSVRPGAMTAVPRTRMQAINARDGRLLRVETILDAHDAARGSRPADVALELGEHPTAADIRDMRLGRPAGYTYAPNGRCILTPVVESWAA